MFPKIILIPVDVPLDCPRQRSYTSVTETCIPWLKHMLLKLLHTSSLAVTVDELFNNEL